MSSMRTQTTTIFYEMMKITLTGVDFVFRLIMRSLPTQALASHELFLISNHTLCNKTNAPVDHSFAHMFIHQIHHAIKTRYYYTTRGIMRIHTIYSGIR